MKISYISLGCAKNQVDFEYLIGELASDGFTSIGDPSKCDAAIINTCGFIAPAVSEAVENILGTASILPKGAKLIVTGCMAERYKEDLIKEMPEIDFIAGVGKLSLAADYLREIFKVKKSEEKGIKRVVTNYPYYAYIKISEGCDSKCSFCTIPSIRGKLKSRTYEEIRNEAEFLQNKGIKEFIIVSQDTASYGKDLEGKEHNILSLLEKLTSEFPKIYFRLLYLNPEGVTDELINIVAKTDNIIKYFEIPVQHASDKILKAMSRKSNRAKIDNVFDNIRKVIPQAIIRTTFIVGFPGETDEDFEILYKFIEDKKPDYAGFFPYYKEEGTKAALIGDEPLKKIVDGRLKKLQSIQKKNTTSKLKELKKSVGICFIEKTNDDFEFILEGRALFQAPDIDGKLYVTDGVATNGAGPYKFRINKIAYPDIYVTIDEEATDA